MTKGAESRSLVRSREGLGAPSSGFQRLPEDRGWRIRAHPPHASLETRARAGAVGETTDRVSHQLRLPHAAHGRAQSGVRTASEEGALREVSSRGRGCPARVRARTRRRAPPTTAPDAMPVREALTPQAPAGRYTWLQPPASSAPSNHAERNWGVRNLSIFPFLIRPCSEDVMGQRSMRHNGPISKVVVDVQVSRSLETPEILAIGVRECNTHIHVRMRMRALEKNSAGADLTSGRAAVTPSRTSARTSRAHQPACSRPSRGYAYPSQWATGQDSRPDNPPDGFRLRVCRRALQRTEGRLHIDSELLAAMRVRAGSYGGEHLRQRRAGMGAGRPVRWSREAPTGGPQRPPTTSISIFRLPEVCRSARIRARASTSANSALKHAACRLRPMPEKGRRQKTTEGKWDRRGGRSCSSTTTGVQHCSSELVDEAATSKRRESSPQGWMIAEAADKFLPPGVGGC
ncbi:hypothetical protein FB451DRAFT_1171164 [Mycena latifolia]|nr:hypothetical protein FB451DRAFT_1171164 [Mycena latifolia]